MDHTPLTDAEAFAKLIRIDATVARILATLIEAGADPEELEEHLMQRAHEEGNDVHTSEAQAFLALIGPACRHALRTSSGATPLLLN